MVKVMICICGKQFHDHRDVQDHLDEKPAHEVDVQQWEKRILGSPFPGVPPLEQWVKIAEWVVNR